MFVAQTAKGAQKFATEVIISAFALNGLDDNRRDVRSFARKDFRNLLFSQFLFCGRGLIALGGGHRKIQHWRADSRPRKFCEVSDFARIGVGEAQGVAAPAMERLLEVNDFCTSLPRPASKFLRTFQSMAALTAFSTAAAPPSIKKKRSIPLRAMTRAKVFTNSANWTV